MKEIFWSILLLTIFTICKGESFQLYRGRHKCDCMEAKACSAWTKVATFGTFLDLPVCGVHNISLSPLLCCPRGDVSWERSLRRSTREIQSLKGINDLHLTCKITSGKSSPVQKAREKCAEYGKLVFQSLFEVSVGDGPYKKELVDTCVKGSDDEPQAKSREFPHMALIGIGEEVQWICAGSLISERFILGVAHCANSVTRPVTWAKLGDLDLSTDDDIARPKIYRIIETIVHPEYKRSETFFYYDIGLYKLEKEIEFSIYVRPACLYTKRDPPNSVADATGWGRFARPSNLLKKVKMRLVSKQECDKTYNNVTFKPLKEGVKYDSMICSVEIEPQGQKICQGDSGGPLQVPLKTPYCMYGLIGITAFGKGCFDGVPGVNTRVSYYVPWIVENVWPDDE